MTKLKGKARARANRKKTLKRRNDLFEKRKNLLSKIRKWEDPVLKQECEIVNEDEDITNIIKELKAILSVSTNGVGLTASQIGYAKNIVAIRNNRQTNNIKIYINLDILERSEEKKMGREGCLSFPGIYIDIERNEKITVSYLDENREGKKEEFSGTDAVIFQHEYDHVLGDCRLYDAWKKSQEEVGSGYEYVESEDLKREKAEKAQADKKDDEI